METTNLRRADHPGALNQELAHAFLALKERVGRDVRGMSEVYINSTPQSLVYRSVGHLDIHDVLIGRVRLLATGKVDLAGVELALELVLDSDPHSRRRKGAFRAIEWYGPDFRPTTTPLSVQERKAILDNESGWLRGGPK